MGNERATDTVTRLTQWIAGVCEAHGGRVVKMLGDGVLAIFEAADGASATVLELQRNHQKRLQAWPAALRMDLQIGVASGEVLEVDGDCYGDAVNLAFQLQANNGDSGIFLTQGVVDRMPDTVHVRDWGFVNTQSGPQKVWRIDPDDVHAGVEA